ncbi:UNVERIFIED_CONTAM: DDT domain-containing protein DDR4 [Sesamum angustifolium]|uniref:DDT domain-containing protein DDR4 n=1 Tax=Sesamum angustifolium TaxID=2727405 RepID=A0AAW2MJT4_9LAMI
MAGDRRRKVATGGNGQNAEVLAISESTTSPPPDVEPVRKKLRERWELASVLNFLHVFGPVIGSDLKISAEDIETALIEQNNILAQLHIDLLKGILPVKAKMKSSDAWMIALSKTLSMWWPWVAEGDFPVTAAKGYDGNETIGHRLYKEANLFEKERAKGKGTLPAINSKWETLATNLEEFNKIVNKFSSSEVKWEVDLSKCVAANVIPVLEKQWKMIMTGQLQGHTVHKLHRCPVDGPMADQDRNIIPSKLILIAEIQPFVMSCLPYNFILQQHWTVVISFLLGFSFCYVFRCFSKRKTSEERKQEENQRQCAKRMGTASNGSYNSDTTSRDGESAVSDAERDSQQGSDDADDSSQEEYDGNQKGNKDQGRVHSHEQNMLFLHRSNGLRFSKRLAGIPGHTAPESMNLGAKNRLRQRPSVNTAVESVVVSDSEFESSSGDEDYLGN